MESIIILTELFFSKMKPSKSVTCYKKDSLLLNIAKPNLLIIENTASIPQEKKFSFKAPLQLSKQWIMGDTSLEVYTTVYSISATNNIFEILPKDKQLGIDTPLVMNVEYLYKI